MAVLYGRRGPTVHATVVYAQSPHIRLPWLLRESTVEEKHLLMRTDVYVSSQEQFLFQQNFSVCLRPVIEAASGSGLGDFYSFRNRLPSDAGVHITSGTVTFSPSVKQLVPKLAFTF